jgi:hypothetical protein
MVALTQALVKRGHEYLCPGGWTSPSPPAAVRLFQIGVKASPEEVL